MQRKIKIAFGTVVYREALCFRKEFMKSIKNQSYKKFDLLLICDNLDDFEKKIVVNEIEDAKLFYFQGYSPSDLRIKLIEIAIENEYDLLIIGDFDDVFSENRVLEYKRQYNKKITFFYNDLFYYGTKKNFFGKLPGLVQNIDKIREENFLGLSNSGINLKKITENTLKKYSGKNIQIFDWLLFSILLIKGGKGKKIKKCGTYYRIHQNNIAGESIINAIEIKREIKIKKIHYELLQDIGFKFPSQLLNKYIAIEKELFENKKLDHYSYRKCNFWWSKIKSTDEQWRNL